MPRLDGVAAALGLVELQPSLRIALHSSDTDALHQRAKGLGVALFDKAELDRLVAWVARHVKRPRPRRAFSRSSRGARRRDLGCSRCGYGIVAGRPPERCPMCHSAAVWTPFARRAGYRAGDD